MIPCDPFILRFEGAFAAGLAILALACLVGLCGAWRTPAPAADPTPLPPTLAATATYVITTDDPIVSLPWLDGP